MVRSGPRRLKRLGMIRIENPAILLSSDDISTCPDATKFQVLMTVSPSFSRYSDATQSCSFDKEATMNIIWRIIAVVAAVAASNKYMPIGLTFCAFLLCTGLVATIRAGEHPKQFVITSFDIPGYLPVSMS